ncbi:MAG: hypothetical protein AAB221_12915 [Bacteroidota bacterium]
MNVQQSKGKGMYAPNYMAQSADGLIPQEYNALDIHARRNSATAALHAMMIKFFTGQKANARNKTLIKF